MPSVTQVSSPSALTARDHVGDAVQILVLRPAPGGAHAEAGGALVLGGLCGGDHFIGLQQGFLLDLAMVRRLRAVAAILRAAAGLDREQGGTLHGIGIVMLPMYLLRPEQQIVEGQFEHGNQRLYGPARSGNEGGDGLCCGMGSGSGGGGIAGDSLECGKGANLGGRSRACQLWALRQRS
jgi:hypothetical protein